MAKDIRLIDKNMQESQTELVENINWHNLNNKYLRGLLYSNGFDRLKQGVHVSENTDHLRKHPSGVNITFETTSNVIKIKASVESKAYMSHMTAVATIGFDLYCYVNKKWVFVSTTKVNQTDYEVTLLKQLDGKKHLYRLYFPLYVGLKEAYLGVDKPVEFIKENQEKIIIYGTSISQGGCASRPGMGYSSIIDRNTNYEVINLGFSGSCKLEEEIGQMIQEIKSKFVILEVEANSPSINHLEEKLPKLIEYFKERKVILISHFPEGMQEIDKNVQRRLKLFRQAQKRMENVIFLDGYKLLKQLNYEGTVDGVHLTDLGFYVLAKKVMKIIEKYEN